MRDFFIILFLSLIAYNSIFRQIEFFIETWFLENQV